MGPRTRFEPAPCPYSPGDHEYTQFQRCKHCGAVDRFPQDSTGDSDLDHAAAFMGARVCAIKMPGDEQARYTLQIERGTNENRVIYSICAVVVGALTLDSPCHAFAFVWPNEDPEEGQEFASVREFFLNLYDPWGTLPVPPVLESPTGESSRYGQPRKGAIPPLILLSLFAVGAAMLVVAAIVAAK